MVQDVLTLDQGFVDIALHPLVMDVLRRYIGDSFTLNEANGWKSLATRRDFHGWHGDAWYDQNVIHEIPREVKLAVYLTEVKSGAFQYIKGSHRKERPRDWDHDEITEAMKSEIVVCTAPAGTAILFDTSGIHRQGAPILEPWQAVFLSYHDPTLPIQEESRRSYRYHPLLLNAAFLGNLSAEDQRVLGFGEQAQLQPAYRGQSAFEISGKLFRRFHEADLVRRDFWTRIGGRIRRTAGHVVGWGGTRKT